MILVAVVFYTGHSSGRRPKDAACPCIVCVPGWCRADGKQVEACDGETFEY